MVVDVRIKRIAEVGCIGQIIDLQTELALNSLGDRKILEQSEVHVGEAGPPHDIAARGTRGNVDTRGVFSGSRKSGTINVIEDTPRMNGDFADNVCPSRAGIPAGSDAEGRAALQGVNSIQLP